MAAPAFAYGGEPVEEVEQPVLTSTTDEEDVVTVTDEESVSYTHLINAAEEFTI